MAIRGKIIINGLDHRKTSHTQPVLKLHMVIGKRVASGRSGKTLYYAAYKVYKIIK